MPTYNTGVTAPVQRLRGGEDRSLVEQAAEAILHAIARGVFLPGDRMVEAYIARDLGFSRVPVREALRRLESQGLLEAAGPRGGLWLIEPTQRDVDELIELRRFMEVIALRKAMANKDKAERWTMMRYAVQEGAAAAATKDASRMLAADRLFHKGLWQAAGHLLLFTNLSQISQRQMVMCSVVQDALAFVAQSEHEGILAAIEAEDLKTAERRLSHHVRWLAREDLKTVLTAAREMRTVDARLATRGCQPVPTS